MKKYLINSNTGDLITIEDDINYYLNNEKIDKETFEKLKGFIPIKNKKVEVHGSRSNGLFPSKRSINFWSKYNKNK